MIVITTDAVMRTIKTFCRTAIYDLPRAVTGMAMIVLKRHRL
jgi:hypothetical protein